MLSVTLALPSGHAVSASVPQSSKVVDLKNLAQDAFNMPFLRLVTAEGRILADSMEQLQAAGLQDGDRVTVLGGQPKLAVTERAFALWTFGDRVVTWGSPDHGQSGPEYGEDSSAVQDQLRGVEQIQATATAFAAILEDGSVIAWGDESFGGDCSEVQAQLRNVKQIQATATAFAAILEDGSVISWGR